MKEALESKIKEYRQNEFENKEFRAWLKESDLWMASFSCLRVMGIEMDKHELVDVLDGKLALDVPMTVYGFVQGFKILVREMQASIGMQESMNEKLFNKFYEILISGEGYRKDNPIIYKWGYIAPHFNDISNRLNELFKLCDKTQGVIEKAVLMHNGIASIYPYGDDSAVMAVVAMYYELMKGEIPLPSFTSDKEEYDQIMTSFFDGKGDGFAEMLERSVMNRLDSVIILGMESKDK